MPFIAPIIAGAIGVGIIGEVLIGAALSLAMGAAARALAPKPRDQDTAGRGMRLSLRLDPNAPREIVAGRAATAGTLVYHNVYGPNGNDYLELVFALSDCACDALECVRVSGVPVTWNSSDGTVDEYPGAMWIKFHDGAEDQVADADLITNSGGRWTSKCRGSGVAHVTVRMKYDQNLYTSGMPRFLFVLRGAKFYDWRLDSTAGGSGPHRWRVPSTYAWTENNIVVAYNYRRGIWLGNQRIMGMNTPAAAMPLAAWTAAANACDESISLKGGGSEKRYRMGGVISSAQTHQENLKDIYLACAATEFDSGGSLRPMVGVAQAPVMSFTDDDIIRDRDVEVTPFLPRNRLVNAVFGSFHDPAQSYESVATPPRLSPADEAADGGIRLEQHYALDFVPSSTQAQRILEILRRRGRQQDEATVPLRARFSVLEAGDWVTWTSNRYGYSAQTFEVQQCLVGRDRMAALTLRRVATSSTAWNPAQDELDPLAPAPLPTGGATLTAVQDLAVAPYQDVPGISSAARPGLRVTWSPITDLTVIEVVFQYRRAGDSVVMEKRTQIPESGELRWLDGIQGDTAYEVRAVPVTEPPRAVEFTGWISTETVTGPVVIDPSGEATVIPPGTINKPHLTPQTQYEIDLSTAVSDVLGSTAALHDDMFLGMNRAGEEALRALLKARTAETGVRRETIVRQTETSALAAQITEAVSVLNGQMVTVTELIESVDGLEGRWGVAVDVDDNVVGLVQLDGSALGSTFRVVANKFEVLQPGIGGGSVVPVFAIANVDDVAKLVLRGDMLADGAISARHITASSITADKLNVASLGAINANLGHIQAGRIESADGKSWWDLNSGEFVIGAP